jgi:hypothetical protein
MNVAESLPLQLPVLMQITVDFLMQRELKECQTKVSKVKSREGVLPERERERENTKSLQVETGMVVPCTK